MLRGRFGARQAALAVFSVVISALLAAQGAPMDGERRNSLRRLFFVPHADKLLVGSSFSRPWSIRFWSLDRGDLEEVVELTEGEGALAIAVSHDGNSVAAILWRKGQSGLGCYSRKERRWLWRNDQYADPIGCPGCRYQLVFTEDNQRVIVTGAWHTAVFDAKTGQLLHKQQEPLSDYPILLRTEKGVALSRTGHYLATWHGYTSDAHDLFGLNRLRKNPSATVWDLEENRMVFTYRYEQGRDIRCAAFSPDDREVLFGSSEGYVSVWSLAEKRLVRQWKAHAQRVSLLVISPGGRFVATRGPGTGHEPYSAVKIWDLASTGLIVDLTRDREGSAGLDSPLAFSADDKYFAFERSGRLCLYETGTWKERWSVLSWPEDPWRKPQN